VVRRGCKLVVLIHQREPGVVVRQVLTGPQQQLGLYVDSLVVGDLTHLDFDADGESAGPASPVEQSGLRGQTGLLDQLSDIANACPDEVLVGAEMIAAHAEVSRGERWNRNRRGRSHGHGNRV